MVWHMVASSSKTIQYESGLHSERHWFCVVLAQAASFTALGLPVAELECIMARSPLVLCLVAAAVMLVAPRAFVSSPKSQNAAALTAGVAAGSMVMPAWAYDQQMMDVQLLLARVPGGKRTKELGLVVPIPEEDGLTDGQIAALFVVALVVLIAAVDLARSLYFGLQPNKFKTAKGKGSITPFMKRLIENGF